jgi:hypothetical protein
MEDPTLTPPPPVVDSPTPDPLPWEEPGRGLFDGLFATIKLFTLEPDNAFSRMAPVGIGRPFFYALIMAWIEMIVGFAYWAVFQFPFFMAGMPELREELGLAAAEASIILVIGGAIFVLMPVLLAIGLAIHSCILHLMLLILGEGRGGFETTVRLLCYSHTADLGNIIPLCGGLISLVWFVVLQVIGVAQGHRCSYGKAALAVLLPILICCACAAVLATVFGAAIMGAIANQ